MRYNAPNVEREGVQSWCWFRLQQAIRKPGLLRGDVLLLFERGVEGDENHVRYEGMLFTPGRDSKGSLF